VPVPEAADPARGLEPYTVPLPDYIEAMPVPEDNPLTHAGVALGRHLFYEPRLSGNNKQACASCHQQPRSFTDGLAVSLGSEGQPADRNAMALVNLAWTAPYFWDGRAPTLEALVPVPIQRPDEMNQPMDELLVELHANPLYLDLFEAAFPGEGITEETLSKALAQFLRTLVSFNAPIDALESEEIVISELEQRGIDLMLRGFPKSDPVPDMCDACHSHRAGVEADAVERNGIYTTNEKKNNGLEADLAMVVPTIRNIAVTGPYMHDGRLASLDAVLSHYDGGLVAGPELEPPLSREGAPMGMELSTAEREELIALMGLFTDKAFLNNPAFGPPVAVERPSAEGEAL